MLGICSSPEFVQHLTGQLHPERPDRIRAIHLAVRQAGLIDSPNPFPDFSLDLQLKPAAGPKLKELSPTPADEKTIELIHTQQMIQRLKHICESGGGVLDQGDTPVSPRSFDLALLSSGAVLTCCDAVMNGTVQRAFAATRPPGHHAEPDRSMGFCLFSNIAIAAKYLQRHHNVDRVAIVDHGKVIALGTSDNLIRNAFGTRSQVLAHFGGSPDHVAPWVAAHGGQTTDGIAQFTIAHAAEIASLLEDSAKAGLELVDVSLRKPNLESVFLHLTGRELRD